jgi:CheY-like chemotaxis protein
MKVLIADDDPTMREVLRHLVTDAGYEIVLATNGEEALAMAEREGPEIVLTDWMMPGIDGVELCEKIRAVAPGRPYIYVIMLTVRETKADVSQGLTAGADDYIVKPFDPGELLARLRAGERIIRLESMLRRRNEELEDSLQTIRQLKSLLPICMFCKKVRDDKNYWQQIDAYIHEHTGTDFTHGVCPDCMKKHYPEIQQARDNSRGPDKGSTKLSTVNPPGANGLSDPKPE